MIVYEFDYVTGEYVGTQEATLDTYYKQKTGKDYWLYPGNCTEIIPPSEEQKGFVPCFDRSAKAWNMVEDHRGETVYKKTDLSPVVITQVGPIPIIYLTTLPEKDNDYQIWDGEEYVYPELDVLKLQVKADLDKKYNTMMSIPAACGRYFVLPSWATIYTNTFVAMQQDEAEDGTLDEAYQILLITDPIKGWLSQIPVSSIEEFMPYYNKVKELFKDITTRYHDKIADISTAETAEDVINAINSFN